MAKDDHSNFFSKDVIVLKEVRVGMEINNLNRYNGIVEMVKLTAITDSSS